MVDDVFWEGGPERGWEPCFFEGLDCPMVTCLKEMVAWWGVVEIVTNGRIPAAILAKGAAVFIPRYATLDKEN